MRPTPPPPQAARRVRVIGAALGVVALAGVAFMLWAPGEDVTDGRHDLQHNGLWLAHGWLGADEWFTKNQKTDKIPEFREVARIAALAAKLRAHHVTDVFPHLAPASSTGALPPANDEQVERFLDAMVGVSVFPWVGGSQDRTATPSDPAWRAAFAKGVSELLAAHPRLAGVHVNIEPCESGSEAYLALLDELRAVLPAGKRLSIAAYPPPTWLHPRPQVHWDERYWSDVAARADQLVPMMYDTALQHPKPYRWLMQRWTRQVLTWAGTTPVLLGLPAYDDFGVSWHRADVENLEHALAGVHEGLSAFDQLPRSYQGVALYADWEVDDEEWRWFDEHFATQPPR